MRLIKAMTAENELVLVPVDKIVSIHPSKIDEPFASAALICTIDGKTYKIDATVQQVADALTVGSGPLLP